MDGESTPRRRQPASDRLTRRKRVIIACQFCRLRKTRCDGIKPVCGFCQRHEACCVWDSASEEADGIVRTSTEREILGRLEEIKTLLSVSATPQQAPQSPTTVSSYAYPGNLPTVSPIPPSYLATRCESILRWPVFHGIVEPSDAAIDSFALECDPGPPQVPSSQPSAMVQENSLVPLCRRFLAYVHARNPILESSELIQYAKHAAEHGLGWDGSSCLVLIACALACYSSPWDEMVTNLPNSTVTEEHEASIASAEAFYTAAKKRIGLLGCSLVDIQCFFFASIYEKFVFGPLQAWLHIQQASVRLQTYLKRQQRLSMLQDRNSANPSENKLLQRAFWSIFKAESELLMELPVKSTGIEEYVRTDSMFPTPPRIINQAGVVEEGHATELPSWQEERSWFFYMAEISLRRTINDMLWLLYRKGESYWLDHNSSLEKGHPETERQMSAWYTHLPDSIRFDSTDIASNEYSFYLQGRVFEWHASALRPFLYFALHRSSSQPLSELTRSYAQESLSVCAKGIVHFHQHHRHGGTWFACRRSFAYSLCILAAVVKPDSTLTPPPDWPSLISTAIATLMKWQKQAADVQAMRLTLESTFQRVWVRVGATS